MTDVVAATLFCVPYTSVRADGALVSCRLDLRRQFVTPGEFQSSLTNGGKVTARALEIHIFEQLRFKRAKTCGQNMLKRRMRAVKGARKGSANLLTRKVANREALWLEGPVPAGYWLSADNRRQYPI